MEENEIITVQPELKTNSITRHPYKEESLTTMPPHIKANFIYRKVWREVWENDSNATFIFIGKPGSGKSVNAIRMCIDLDPTFNEERICYNIEDFLNLLDKGDKNGELHPGNCILFDEIVTDRGADSRSAMSKTNKLMNYINATFRAKRLVVFYCLPSLTQLDKNIRDINVTGLFEVIDKNIKKKKNLCKFHWSSYDAKTQKVFYIYPRLVNRRGQIKKVSGVWIGLPPKDFEDAYKKKKMAYLKSNISRWNIDLNKNNNKKIGKQNEDKEIMSKINLEKEKFLLKGRFNAYLIKEAFGLGTLKANMIAGYMNKSQVLS